jgi:disulfide bond formation protein DsbB
MPMKLNSRAIFAAVALGCLGILLAAAYMQYGPEKRQPCPYCILQRYAFILVGIIAAIAAIHGPKKTGNAVYAGLALLASLAGVSAALWQVMKGSTMTSCLADPVGEFVNSLPTANWWPQYFFANGGCADKIAPVLGIPIPVWSLFLLSTLSAVAIFIGVTTMRKGRNP